MALLFITNSICFDKIRGWIRNYADRITHLGPRADSGVVRTDPLRFLTGCHKRRLNQV